MSCSYQITCLKPVTSYSSIKIHHGKLLQPMGTHCIPSIFEAFQAPRAPRYPTHSPRVPGTGQGGYDMDLVFRQEIGQRLLPRLQQHLKRWAINVGGRNKTWRGCEGWEYLCTSLYIYIYIYIYTANPGLLPRSRNNDYVPYDNNDNNNGNHNDNNKKKHIHTYLYICTCVCVKSHIQNMPHIYILTSSHVYIYLYTSHLVCLSKYLQKEKPRDRQVAAIDDREFTLLALLWNRINFTSWTMGIAIGFVDGLWEFPRTGVKMVGFYS